MASERKIDLKAIAARAEKATPGPWEVFEWTNDVSQFGKDSGKDSPATVRTVRTVRTTWKHGQLKDYWPIIHQWFAPYLERKEYADIEEKDAAFIAHARTDIPALVDWARRAAEELKSVCYCEHKHGMGTEKCSSCKLLAELDLAQQQAGGSAEGV